MHYRIVNCINYLFEKNLTKCTLNNKNFALKYIIYNILTNIFLVIFQLYDEQIEGPICKTGTIDGISEVDEVNKVTISFEEDMVYTATLATLMNMLDEGNPQMAYDSTVLTICCQWQSVLKLNMK